VQQVAPQRPTREQARGKLGEQQQPEHGAYRLHPSDARHERGHDNKQQDADVEGEQHVARAARPGSVIFIKATQPCPKPLHRADLIAKLARLDPLHPFHFQPRTHRLRCLIKLLKVKVSTGVILPEAKEIATLLSGKRLPPLVTMAEATASAIKI
jgi:hypothetical protein